MRRTLFIFLGQLRVVATFFLLLTTLRTISLHLQNPTSTTKHAISTSASAFSAEIGGCKLRLSRTAGSRIWCDTTPCDSHPIAEFELNRMRAPNWPRESFHGTYDATSVTLTITQALALYNCLELLLLIFVTFHRWRGLYFWSLTIATIGTISYGLGLMIEYFDLAVLWVGKIFDTGGWMVMVTGQSVVLYSRLGLILANPRILRAVKWMIIIDACMFHGVTTIVDWGRYTHNPAYARGYFYIEHIQMTFFCIQGA